MSRLKMLKPRVQTLPSRLAEPQRPRREEGPRFYDRRAWRDHIRPQKLRRNPLCEYCLEQGRTTVATEVDHVDGNAWNNAPENHRSACRPCHAAKGAREDGLFGNPKRQA